MTRPGYIAAILALSTIGFAGAAAAQGVPRGIERGAADGNRAAGPIGGVVGGAVGGAVGGVNGVLGIDPDRRRGRSQRYRRAPRRDYR